MKNLATAENLLSNFFEDEDGCWVWTMARTPGGYGRLLDGYAHRLAYELFIGDIEPDYCIDHLCRNRACINPEHLEAVTQTENKLRGVGCAAVNARKTHCAEGHEFTIQNTYTMKDGGRACKKCAYTRGQRFRRDNPTYGRDYLRQWRAGKRYA